MERNILFFKLENYLTARVATLIILSINMYVLQHPADRFIFKKIFLNISNPHLQEFLIIFIAVKIIEFKENLFRQVDPC